MRLDSPYRRPDGHEQRSLRTRARIFETAVAAFRGEGFEAASVAAIARAAGVSRPSFYAHFPSKEHVLLELQWQLEMEVVESLAPIDSPREAVHVFVDRLLAIEEEVGSDELFRDILQFWARPTTRLDVDQQSFPSVDELVRRFVAHARRGGRLPLPPERSALLFLSSVFGYLLGAVGSREEKAEDLHTLAAMHLGEAGSPG